MPSAYAHEMRPAYLELTEPGPGDFSVLWKTPMVGDARLSLTPEFSGDVQPLTPVMTRMPVGAAVQTWTMRAPALRGQTLHIRGIESTMTEALVRFSYADGTTWTQLLTPQQPSAVIPAQQPGWSVAGEYLKMGVGHILLGIDHLLFVLALLLIVAGWKRLLATITAFTAAHSITLAAATLGFVHVPQAPVEALIALSIVFVATEILHTRQGRDGHCGARALDRRVHVRPVARLRLRRRLERDRLAAGTHPARAAVLQCGRRTRPTAVHRRRVELHRFATARPDSFSALEPIRGALCHRQRGDVLGDFSASLLSEYKVKSLMLKETSK